MSSGKIRGANRCIQSKIVYYFAQILIAAERPFPGISGKKDAAASPTGILWCRLFLDGVGKRPSAPIALTPKEGNGQKDK
jgi:hypothetical protein